MNTYVKNSKDSVKYFIEFLKREKIYHSPNSLKWYFEEYLFKNIDFKNKTILDIGGGIGLISFFAAASGASQVVLLEPESSGSGSNEMKNFTKMIDNFSFSHKIQLLNTTFQEFNAQDMKFDVIVSHNSINHLDENACINLLNNRKSREIYLNLFKKMYNILQSNADIIIADCSNNNFFNKLGLNTPLARNVEWYKHQEPKTWAKLMVEVGFLAPEIEWSSYKQLRGLGHLILGNKIAAYFLTSHFKIHAKKISAVHSIDKS